MLRADEDGRMLFLHNEFLLYIFKCKWNTENRQIWTKISNFVQSNSKKHLVKCKFKYNDNTIEILQISQQQKAEAEAFESRRPKLQSIDGLFESKKVKGSNIVKRARKKHFSYIIHKTVSLRRNFSKALVILSWFLLLLFLLFLLMVYISLAFQLRVFQSELFHIFIV